MVSDLDTIRAKWRDLNVDPLGDATAARYRIGGTPKFGVFLLVRYPEKTPALEMGPLTPDVVKSSPLPDIKGIEQHLTTEARRHYLAMDLKQIGAVDVFLTLAARLCEELKDTSYPISAYGRIRDVLTIWQSFFSPDRRALTEARQTGLAGELIFLDTVIESGVEQTLALRSWKGSEKSHHDFHFQGVSVEVKSTTAVRTDVVSISNLRQLEKTGADRLLLTQVMLDVHEVGDFTLPNLVKRMRDRYEAISGDLLCLEEKLVEAGYRAEDEVHYVSRSYTLRKIKSFPVDDQFPKIITSDVDDGVLDAVYKISLAGVEDTALDFEYVARLLRRLISE
jgi:hypothetical protein